MIRNYPGFSQGISGATLAQEMLAAGLGLRHHVPVHAPGREPVGKGRPLPAAAVRRQRPDRAHRDHRDRRHLPAARHPGPGGPAGPGGLLRRRGQRGTGHARAERVRRRRRQLRRAGRAAHGQMGPAGDDPGPRGESLADSMSDYLIRQIGATPNIDVCYHVQVADGTGTGTGHLQSLVLEDTASGARRSVPADALFVLIGSQPRTAMARREPSHATSGGSSSPARTCPPAPATAGPPAARRCRWRPACPGCSPPVTCARDRSNGSPPRSAKAPPPSPWSTATCKPPRRRTTRRCAGQKSPSRPAHPRPGLSQRPGERAYAHRAQHDRHPAG